MFSGMCFGLDRRPQRAGFWLADHVLDSPALSQLLMSNLSGRKMRKSGYKCTDTIITLWISIALNCFVSVFDIC